jgi:hypothetical protein
MEKNIKVRVIIAYNDIKENNQYYSSGTIRFLDCQRARELYQKGIIAIMEIRKCKYE